MNLGTIIGILLAGAFGIVGTLLGTYYTGRNQQTLTRELFEEQKEREKIAYARQVTEARRDRLIKRYEEVVLAAHKYVITMGEKASKEIIDPDTKKNYGPIPLDVLVEMADKERNEFEKAYTLLAIEVDNKDVIDLCEILSWARQDMDEAYNMLVAAVRAHVQELERTA